VVNDPRSKHPKLVQALERLGSADLAGACAAAAPPGLIQGIHEFNAGEFFDQHETLETLWRATPDEIRHLYEGILQIGVGMHHLLVNGIQLLEAFPAVCHGVDVARLRRDAKVAREHLVELGPKRLDAFDRGLIPRVHLVSES
jgi:predicted metal-dependent hydrolase